MNSPQVSKSTLRLIAGVVWTTVGLALCITAMNWLVVARGNWIAPLAVGAVAGILVYRFGFSRLVKKNTARIYEQAPGKSKACMFAFQSWRSYIIIVVMVTLGYVLRHLPVSRMYLVPVYLAIGVGLLLASLHYYPAPE